MMEQATIMGLSGMLWYLINVIPDICPNITCGAPWGLQGYLAHKKTHPPRTLP